MSRQPVTYKEIQTWVRSRFGFVPKTCWIAHRKEAHGMPNLRRAPNRHGEDREEPCPPDKEAPIDAAFRHFGMIG